VKIEHVAFQVQDPQTVARWYVQHLGLVVKRSQLASPFGQFLADSAGVVMLEFYQFPQLPVPDYRSMDPMLLHIAYWTDNIDETRARLIAAGATPHSDVQTNDAGDVLTMLRDPWGLPLQLVHRAEPLLTEG
jgi:catechol 2,3-dioxygenase-like lactoylglutathione lyase family enzyme